MKARETALKLKRFETDEKARKVADLEHMIREFETIASDLDRQVHAEEDRTGIKDIKHFAYSTFAKSASQRRDNLRASIGELRMKLEAAQKDHDDLLQQLARASADEPRDSSADRSSRRRTERGTSMALR